VGPETLDDAAALGVSDDLAILFTADIITPVVDEARTWGRIAAANSISDIYAMGGRPLAALNLVCWSKELPPELLAEVLDGGKSAADDAECPIAGGHTVEDKEPKYGMAVIGTVHPEQILRNQGARPGDSLYLTKRLGTGIIATATKAELAEQDEIDAAIESMSALNRAASEAAVAASVHALTDVTGFGLAGHLVEMLGPDGNLGVELSFDSLPLLPGVLKHISMGMVPGGAYRNRDAYAQRVQFDERIPDGSGLLLFDPQTSGGLLAAVSPDNAEAFEKECTAREVTIARIGTFNDNGQVNVL